MPKTKRDTTNERSIRLTNEAIKVYESWPYMERSKKTSEAIIQYDSSNLEKRVELLESEVKDIKERIGEK